METEKEFKETPKYIHNYDRFDSATEAMEAYRNLPNIEYKNGIKFLDWLAWKIDNPDMMSIEAPRWHKTIWDRALKKFRELRTVKNIDAFQWTADLTGKMIYDLWMKFEVNNPPGSSMAGKRWIVDWLYDEICPDLKHYGVIEGK